MKKILILCLMLPAVAVATPEPLKISEKGIKIECLDKQDSSKAVECSVKQKNLSVLDVFQIESPARVVMDLVPMARGNSGYFDATNIHTLKGIRTGWHPDKYRIVFDINSDVEVDYQWNQTGEKVNISLKPTATIASDLSSPVINLAQRAETVDPADNAVEDKVTTAAIDKPEATAELQPPILAVTSNTKEISANLSKISLRSESSNFCTDESVMRCSVEDTPQMIPPQATAKEVEVASLLTHQTVENSRKSEDQAIQRAKADVAIEPTDLNADLKKEGKEIVRARMNPQLLDEQESTPFPENGQILKGVQFEESDSSTSDSSLLHLQLTKRPNFNLSRTGPRTYKLRIVDCKLSSEAMTLPFFPPHTFPGISFVQAKKSSSATELTIGVERGARLQAVSTKSGIDIRVAT